MKGDGGALRLQMAAVKALLAELSLLSLPDVNTSTAEPVAAVLDAGFDALHWSFFFLCLDSAAAWRSAAQLRSPCCWPRPRRQA